MTKFPRIDKAIEILRKHRITADVYADLGCGDGAIAEIVAKAVDAKTVYYIDISEEQLMRARERGLITRRIDLSTERLPLDDESVDLVTAFEVIEHLINSDNMLREAHRVLKQSGYLLLSTPNLASWVNRVTFLLGFQPYNAEVSTEILAGVPIKKRTFMKPAGHIRPFTLKALKELLTHHKFKVVDVKGAPGIEPKEIRILDELISKIPSLARRLIVLAQKP